MLEFDTTNLLRPHQVAEAEEELKQLSDTLNAPPHIRSRISDPREMRARRDRLRAELEKFTPRAYGPSEKDLALREFHTLEEQIKVGMPSSEEMRRNPPGAVSKQLAWDKQNGKKVLRLKHIGLRLAAGGDIPESLRHQGDISNIERLRPLTTANQLSMDGAQIPKVRDIHIGSDPANAVSFTDEEIALLKVTSPELESQLALLPSEARAGIKAILKAAMAKPPAPEITKVEKRRLKATDNGWNRAQTAARKAGIRTYGKKAHEVFAELKAAGIEV